MKSPEPGVWSRRARSFGDHAEQYARYRPAYPMAATEWALAQCGRRNLHVLDLGAGTGKLTANLVAVGARVTAVEPDARMWAFLAAQYPQVVVKAGSAEAIPLLDGSMDAVLIGQAFHWFDQERAFSEIARVLRPGGTCAALWNEHDTVVPWVAGLHRVAPFLAEDPERQHLSAHPSFTSVEHAGFAHAWPRTVESLTGMIGTHSATLVMSGREREALLERVSKYLRDTPETGAETFYFPLVTHVFRCALRV
ncbi:class I SAM-dependent methyltransferase [Nocardia brasiliensis]